MTVSFRPAQTGQAPIFVMISGGTGTGKSFSAFRLARGMVGPNGRIFALDTEAGRLSTLAKFHRFDMLRMEPPFRWSRIADFAEEAEVQGADALVIDSASMGHVGPGGHRAWVEEEVDRMLAKKKRFQADLDVEDEGEREKVRWSARRAPSLDRQEALYSFLQRRIPIIFACRARELTEKQGAAIKSVGWQPVIHAELPYEMTTSFLLDAAKGQGIISHGQPCKIDADHRAIFGEGAQVDEAMGAAFMEVMRGTGAAPAFQALRSDGMAVPFRDFAGWRTWWDRAVREAPPDALRKLREANGPLMGEYAGEHSDEVMALQKAIASKLGEAADA
ncbi:hypothetical protein [Muricoccus vinaceus]|uniref:AAA+ ATPase domain-containing protein n=1 Tax=Muricoccus vinaceus TaxID=424704 RepID=A0ABV6ILC2_9PROT